MMKKKYYFLFILGIMISFSGQGQNHSYPYIEAVPTTRSISAEINRMNKVIDRQMGVSVKDLKKHRLDHNVNHNGQPNWIRVENEKQTCCGTMKKFGYFNGAGDEHDWNIYLRPNADFDDMVDDAIRKRRQLWRSGYRSEGSLPPTIRIGRNELFFWWPFGIGGVNPRMQPRREHIQIEGEITPKKSLRKSGNPWGYRVVGLLSGDVKTNRKICMYGPFALEERHNYRPEIHPCEAIWWKKNGALYLFSSHDESGRFHQWQSRMFLEHEWRLPFKFDPSKKKLLYIIQGLGSKNAQKINRSKSFPTVTIKGQDKVVVNVLAAPRDVRELLQAEIEHLSVNETNGFLQGELVLRFKAGRRSGADTFGQFYMTVIPSYIDDPSYLKRPVSRKLKQQIKKKPNFKN